MEALGVMIFYVIFIDLDKYVGWDMILIAILLFS